MDFFEAFRNYDEAGSLQRIQVLKYLVLTTMLVQSSINPFDSPETKPYVGLRFRSGTTDADDDPFRPRSALNPPRPSGMLIGREVRGAVAGTRTILESRP